jgi:hypothetical protein
MRDSELYQGSRIQADFEDYREIDGVRMPFIVRWSSPSGAWGTKVSTKILNIQQNVPIEDEQFNGPPSTPLSLPKTQSIDCEGSKASKASKACSEK